MASLLIFFKAKFSPDMNCGPYPKLPIPPPPPPNYTFNQQPPTHPPPKKITISPPGSKRTMFMRPGSHNKFGMCHL